jgi:hypothetical protein
MIPSRTLAAAAATALCLASLPASAQGRAAAPDKRLDWLAGCWESADKMNRETWMGAPGGMMFGHATRLEAGRLAFFEQARIDLRTTPSTYTVSPMGARASTFVENPAATPPKTNAVVFENPDNEYPQRLAYASPKRNQLTATISQLDGSRSATFEWKKC